MYKYIDLSHTINQKISVYPGQTQPIIEVLANVKQNGYRISKIHMLTHNGTHIDAPNHFIQNGKSVDQIEIHNLTGKARIINIKKTQPQIIQEINSLPNNIDFVILYNGWSKYWETQKYRQVFPIITQQMAELLVAKKLKGVGTDCLSVDCVTSTDFKNHKIILQSGMVIIQNLRNLEQLVDKQFEIFLFPLKIEGGDGSPTRVVARI